MSDGGFNYVAARWAVFGLRREGERVIDVAGDLRPPERLVLLAMIEHAPVIAPSIARLATMTGLTRRSVMQQIQSLEARGIVRVKRSNGSRSGYALDLDRCTAFTSEPPSPVHHVHPTREPPSPPPVNVVHGTGERRSPEAGIKRASEADKEADKSLAVAPAPAEVAPKAKGKRGTGTAKPTHPGTDSLKIHYVAELKRLRQTDAVFDNWGRAQRALSDLANLVGEERAKAVITTALGNAYCSRIQPWELKTDVNKHSGMAPVRNGQRQGPAQPNTGAVRPEDYS